MFIRFRRLMLFFTVMISINNISFSFFSNQDGINVKPGREVLQIIKGVWVKTDYIESIMQTRSPYESSEELEGLVAFLIDQSTLKGDTLNVDGSLNNHEGFNFNLFLDKITNGNSILTDISDYETKDVHFNIEYNITSKDTILILKKITNSNKCLEQIKYTRVSDKLSDNESGLGINTFVNKNLFAGKYSLVIPKAKKQSIELTADGKIIGWKDYNEYEVMTDFDMADDDECVDQIILKNGDKLQTFGFVFKGNSIKFYNLINLDPEGIDVKLGKPKFDLVK
jgi:hypothetical protein